MSNPADTTILIYAGETGPRLSYIVSVLFAQQASITNSLDTFNAYKGARINYSAERIVAESSDPEPAAYLWVVPHGLLEQQTIQPQATTCFQWKGQTAFFATIGDLPFDIFAASFYLISRYEEYLPHSTDRLGRYLHSNSIACREQFLHLPLVQLWLGQLPPVFGAASILNRKFSFVPTYDIDIAYSYRHHSLLRNTAGFIRDFLQADLLAVKERTAVLNGLQQDPYDVYEWLDLLHSSLRLKPVYFFLVAATRRGLDKNISPGSPAMKKLIARTAKQYTIGLHPSLQSGSDKKTVERELQLIDRIAGVPVKNARNHYIHLQFPVTYQRLNELGITNDYSMGYPSANGFRASIAIPFPWFDLQKNETTSLVIHPFCYMDATAIFQEKSSIEKAAADLQYYFDAVKAVGGDCVTIFHNHFLTRQPAFIEWRNGYADFLLKNFTR